MANELIRPSSDLRLARRSLERLDFVSPISNFIWFDDRKQWLLECSITIDSSPTQFVPKTTNWHVFVDSEYPEGGVHFFPSVDGGIEVTFQHQTYNSILDGQSWRTGNLCLEYNTLALARAARIHVPNEPDQKLKWYFRRAIEWLENAASGNLQIKGQRFEMPDFRRAWADKSLVAYSEDEKSLRSWTSNEQRLGYFNCVKFLEEDKKGEVSNCYIISKYFSPEGEEIFEPAWQSHFADLDDVDCRRGIWFLLSDIPVKSPWQTPKNWGEVAEIFRSQGRDLYHEFTQVLHLLRDGSRHFMVIGFPVSGSVGDEARSIHWQGVLLPKLSSGSNYAKGFRRDEQGYLRRDFSEILALGAEVEWVKSQNWHEDQIRTRGRAETKLRESGVAIFGCGALGSSLSEILVRNGIQNVILVDPDRLEIGNLCRHTLSMTDLGVSKCKAVAERLHDISPNVNVHTFFNSLALLQDIDLEIINDVQIVIDTTGEDEVIRFLGSGKIRKDKVVASFSIGYEANRLYSYICRSFPFPVANFFDSVSRWIQDDIKNLTDEKIVFDYTGCWHPVFPAKANDIWSVACLAYAALEYYVQNDIEKNVFLVHKKAHEGFSSGYRVEHENNSDEI